MRCMKDNVPGGRYWEPAAEEAEEQCWMPETEEELIECYEESTKNDELPFV